MKVAVVTGAARGIGRGIALVLGETGATVYLTDRVSLEETARQVAERGGNPVAVRLDHTDDAAVEALFGRVEADHGGLDLLVANAFNGNALPFAPAPFWTMPIEHWHNMMDCGVRAHLVAAKFAAPLLIKRRGLLVLTGYADPGSPLIAGHAYYDLAMTATSRLAATLAHELKPHGVTALCVSPGFTRTEAVVAALGDDLPPGTDSVEFPGRAVRALWQDPEVAKHAGRTIPVAELSATYGFTDPGDA